MPSPTAYRAKDGSVSWRVRLRVGGRQTTETFDSHVAAVAFCSDVEALGAATAVEQRNLIDQSSESFVPTVAQLLATHVDELTGIDQRTRDDYHAVARRTWLPMIGRLRVDAVNRAVVAAVINRLDGQYAPKTIKNAHSVLSGVLQTAVYKGHLDSNPARGIRLPRAGEQDVEENRYLTYEEFDRLLAAVPAFYIPFVVLLFGTGLRFSEATALQVQDVDTERGTLRVMRAWKRQKGVGMRIGPPKSAASRRTIVLPVEVLDALSPLMVNRAGSDWLFTTITGGVIMHSNFYNRIWVRACEDAGLEPRPRIHDARHTHASWLIAAGVRLEAIQDRLGHESYMTTKQTYGHLMPAMRAEAGLAASVAFAATSLRRPALPAGQ